MDSMIPQHGVVKNQPPTAHAPRGQIRTSAPTLGQVALDTLLSRQRHLPVTVMAEARPPDTRAYAAMRNIDATGFQFTLRMLLHAIGCKTGNIPMDDEDDAVSSATLYTRVLDLDRKDLGFKKEVRNHDPDLLTNRSHELGIGIACLFAWQIWGFPWDQLGAIRSKGKHFDYRAEQNGVTAIIEAKGATSETTHRKQLDGGLIKKVSHHKRGERFDIELIVATFIAPLNVGSRITVADPEYEVPEHTFGPEATKLYSLRHWSKVMQFIGQPSVARWLYVLSNDVLRPGAFRYRGRHRMLRRLRNVERLSVGKRTYVGRWTRHWLPRNSVRYSSQLALEKRLMTYGPSIEVFQGVSEYNFEMVLQADSFYGVDVPMTETIESMYTDDRLEVSVFPDGTALAIRYLADTGGPDINVLNVEDDPPRGRGGAA